MEEREQFTRINKNIYKSIAPMDQPRQVVLEDPDVDWGFAANFGKAKAELSRINKQKNIRGSALPSVGPFFFSSLLSIPWTDVGILALVGCFRLKAGIQQTSLTGRGIANPVLRPLPRRNENGCRFDSELW